MTEKKDILLTSIQYGVEKMGSPFTWKEFLTWLEKKEHLTDENKEKLSPILDRYKGEIFGTSNGELYHLNVASYFHLLEYEELKESRISSNQARCLAWIAIIISILTFAYFAYISSQPIKIDPAQFKLLIQDTITKAM